MSKKIEDADRVRKAYAPRGQRSQVRITFLLDEENVEQLRQQPNKSRYLNNLISKDRGR